VHAACVHVLTTLCRACAWCVATCSLALLCCLPVTQFCTEAFAAYARLTDADVIFGSQVRNLQFFRLFFQNNVFLYGMLIISFLALVYFVRAHMLGRGSPCHWHT